MQMDEILKEYCEKNPIYKNLLFSSLIKVYSSTRKKIMFSAKSSVKQEGQIKKYEAGAELGESYGKVY